METAGRYKLFISTHRQDIGMFILRFALSFVFVAHSAAQIIGVTALAHAGSWDFLMLLLALAELVSGIMILSGFLVAGTSYFLALLLTYYLFFAHDQLGLFYRSGTNAFAFLAIAANIATALVGPGKIVLNKRYGHVAHSLREHGVDPETEIMGT